jgi:uncharacterized membrane protein YvlD (DUF360 family)
MAQTPLGQALGRLVFASLSVFLVAKILPGLRVRGLGAAFVFSIAVGLLDALAWRIVGSSFAPWGRWVSLWASWAVTALAFWAGGRVIKGVEVDGCLPAVLGSFGVALVSGLLSELWHRAVTGRPLLPPGWP